MRGEEHEVTAFRVVWPDEKARNGKGPLTYFLAGDVVRASVDAEFEAEGAVVTRYRARLQLLEEVPE